MQTNWLRSGAAGGAGNFHSTAPVLASSAYIRPLPLPMKTRLLYSIGEARKPASAPATVSAAGTLNVQRTASVGTFAGFDRSLLLTWPPLRSTLCRYMGHSVEQAMSETRPTAGTSARILTASSLNQRTVTT